MWQPPTDNLYKFLAIFGLILVVGSSYVLLDRSGEYERQVVTWNAAWGPLFERQHQAIEDALQRLDCKTPAACKELKEREAQWELVRQQDRRAVEELSKQREMLDFLRKQLILYQTLGFVVLVIGFAAMGWGFSMWYYKLQRHLDRQVAAPSSAPPPPSQPPG